MSADVAPPANRQDLTHSGIHTEQGKPLPLLTQESKLQGKPIEVRVKDDRKSEGHLVMRWIGVAGTTNITPSESRLISGRMCSDLVTENSRLVTLLLTI